ncbi:MAG: putative amidohydrolase YtcJ [Thermoproteota archaeon]|jgi:predicted amidohydrolase YtcJ
MTTTIYPARRIITMNPAVPFAEAVAVRDGRVLAVGTVEELAGWGEHIIDNTFDDKVLTPGFIEAHTHVMAGGVWQFPYVGFFDRKDPEGKVWTGCKSVDEVLDRLAEYESQLAEPGDALVAWGLDPIYFPAERLLAVHLDRVSETRPIYVYHASAHLATVNTAMLDMSEINEHATTPGVARNADGTPNGELQEPAAMGLARYGLPDLFDAIVSDEAKWNYAYEARNAGHTLVTDLGTTRVNDEQSLQAWRTVTADPDYPTRVMVAGSPLFGGPQDPDELASIVDGLKANTTDKLRFGIVKLVLDGSIQGFTARITWPYYYNPPEGADENGLWLMAPDQIADIVTTLHKAGITVHCHCNGDQAAEVFINAVEVALERHPRWDHRHTVQHSQLTTPSQYKRMAALGMCANIFSNHIFYWGDQHRDITVGPERAARMNACATALREGVSFSIHSDTPITPMGHLHTAWCAVNRVTATGEVLGPDERISVMDAMKAITLDAAYQLKLDHEMGSIESGKLADFAVLEDDPLKVDPMALKDIQVWGTVLGGVLQPA